MASSKAVITCTDSGGPLDFVADGATGAVVPPDAAAIAEAIDRVVGDLTHARALGEAGRAALEELDLSWARTVDTLLS
jgi:glycosyltransferase involved in cell wall biosynthesis